VTIRYWDDSIGGWAYAESIWDGKALPMDNSGWTQKQSLLGRGTKELGQYPSTADTRKKALPDVNSWKHNAVFPVDGDPARKCGCGRLKARDEKRCRNCATKGRNVKRQRAASLPFEEVA